MTAPTAKTVITIIAAIALSGGIGVIARDVCEVALMPCERDPLMTARGLPQRSALPQAAQLAGCTDYFRCGQ
jgi:hypothetical protein